MFHMLKRRRASKRAKAGWTTFMVVLPSIGCMSYVASALGFRPVRTRHAGRQPMTAELVTTS
jgi:hypothetical protein